MPEPYFTSDGVELYLGDCRAVLAEMPDASVDAIVTDPPYELGFMGRAWDASGIAFDPIVWRECLRVLKPGGHLVAFGGTRTYHRLAVAIEDARFEIRDTLQWLYGGGFPKSLDVSKAIDKAAGAKREIVGRYIPPDGRRRPNSMRSTGTAYGKHGGPMETPLTAPATDEAIQWEGWGTALKPGWEPIVLARKALAGTVAANVLEYGTGAINIAACRVEPTGESRPRVGETSQETRYTDRGGTNFAPLPGVRGGAPEGRWPTNLVFTHNALCVEDGPCEPGGTVRLPAYDGAFGVVAHSAEPAYLLGRLQALLQSLRASSRSGTSLWRGAYDFYRSAGSRSSEAHDEVSLLDAVSRALRASEVPGSPAGCLSCRDSDGERLRRVLGACQAGLPSLLDVLADEIHQVTQDAHIRGRRCPDRLSSSDAPRAAEPASCNHRSSTSGGCSCLLSGDGTRSRNWGTGSSELLQAEPGGSTLPSSTASPCGNSESRSHTGCTDATVRLLTLLAFDLASRFVIPNPGVHTQDIAFTLPPCPVAELDRQSGNRRGFSSQRDLRATKSGYFGADKHPGERSGFGDQGGASRFFPTFRYEAKAPTSERPKLADGTAWPTVKPVDLMRWLVRLITPPGGTVLDCFAGTGTTGEAAIIEGFQAVLIERDPVAAELIKARFAKPIAPTLDLFSEVSDA